MRRSHDITGTPRWWRSDLCQEALVTLTLLSGVAVMVLLSWFLTFQVLDHLWGPEGSEAHELTVNGDHHLADEVFGDAPCAVICRDPTGGKDE